MTGELEVEIRPAESATAEFRAVTPDSPRVELDEPGVGRCSFNHLRERDDLLHELRVNMRLMKNVTITLDEKTAAWARNHAARHEMSLSRFVGELLEKTMWESREYGRAMRSYLSRKPTALKKRGGHYPRRDELHDRHGLR